VDRREADDEQHDHRGPERPGSGEPKRVEDGEEEGVRDGHHDGEDEPRRLIPRRDAVLEEPAGANERLDPRAGDAARPAVTATARVLDPRRHDRAWDAGRQRDSGLPADVLLAFERPRIGFDGGVLDDTATERGDPRFEAVVDELDAVVRIRIRERR
jgi:hypothetical protein